MIAEMLQLIVVRREKEQTALIKWQAGVRDETLTQPEREQLWAEWRVCMAGLERAINVLREEDARRAELLSEPRAFA